MAEVARLFNAAGTIVLVSVISPFRADRENAGRIIGAERFYEVYVSTPLEVCEQRDVKGLYAKARRGEIKGFTGIDDPYETPDDAELVIDTSVVALDDAVTQVLSALG